MITLKRILVPTDFGGTSARALGLAIELAEKLDAEITLMHAYVLPIAVYGYGESLAWPTDDLEQAAQKALDHALATAKQRYSKMKGVLASGDAWAQILEVAKQSGADLIVMGTHGRHGVARAFLGSVAEKVVRLSPVPVLTVGPKPT
jgi:nucleotide-binding universal stress UspA family protein